MTLKIAIKMENAAFEDEAGTEVARILRRIADDIEGRDMISTQEHGLLDYNGNRVGELKVTH